VNALQETKDGGDKLLWLYPIEGFLKRISKHKEV
jgi:hypothetical protein